MGWYLENNGAKTGPVDDDEIPALVDRGEINDRTMVWQRGMENWEPAFQHIDGVSPPPPGSMPATPPPQNVAPVYADTGRDYRRQSGVVDATRQFFQRYFDFSGRSNRGEYWYWVLVSILISLVLGIIEGSAFSDTEGPLTSLFALATLIPNVALGARRLHDISKSGWWLLLWFIPIIGWIVLIYWFCQKPHDGPNAYG